MNEPLFIHCHIFKNAGTSLIESFRHAFHENAIELEPDDPDNYLSDAQIAEALVSNPNLVFISSHRVRLPLPPFINDRKIIPIILFRDPIDRLGSVYRFEQRETRATVYAALAKISSMQTFFDTILDVGFDVIISNVHAGFCSTNTMCSIEGTKRYLKNHALIGLVEDYHFSMALIEQEVKKHYPEKTLLVFRENVTRGDRNILSSCIETINEISLSLTKIIMDKNNTDYQLYDFVCDHLHDAWRVAENKNIYLHYCRKNKIEKAYTNMRIASAPSLQCAEKNNKQSKKEDKKYYASWTRLRKPYVNKHKPIVEAIKLEFFSEHKCLSIEPGQELCIDFKIRWPYAINCPAVNMTIKSHTNTIVLNTNGLCLQNGSGVNEDDTKVYRFKFAVPEIVSGLYKIDIQAGIGRGDRFKALTIAEAVTAFGVKSAISAGSDFVPIEAANTQMKCLLLN